MKLTFTSSGMGDNFIRWGVSCSWCHELAWDDDLQWPYCKHCGHRADLPRVQCDCPACALELGLSQSREPAE